MSKRREREPVPVEELPPAELGQGIKSNRAQKLVHRARGWGLAQVFFQLVLFSQIESKVGGRMGEERGKAAD